MKGYWNGAISQSDCTVYATQIFPKECVKFKLEKKTLISNKNMSLT